MPTHNVNLDWSNSNDTLSRKVTITADGEANVSVAVADGAVNLAVNIAIDITALKLLYLVADQDLTIKTNDGVAPDDTINLKAGKPLIWFEDSGFDNPLTVDVTSLHVTNASGSAATLTLKTLQDATA